MRRTADEQGMSGNRGWDDPRLVGSVRIGRGILPGTRTERLPFACHPRAQPAFLAGFDPTVPLQYWEQNCRSEGCHTHYRFEHDGRLLRWYPIRRLTDPTSRPAVPLDRTMVTARLVQEADRTRTASTAPTSA
jgi:hypothetical protein